MTQACFHRTFALAGCALAVGLTVSSAMAQDQPITGDQIKATWVGKKIFGRSTNGGLLDMYMRADGTSEVSVGNMQDTGVWRTTDTGYCTTWKKIRPGQERCFTVVKRGDKTLILNPDGSLGTEVLRVVD